ncbi:MAG: PAS domain S-box protein, partial [Ruminococcus sp.]|nr:PAS domain S-box protein [Ruminococcus sp.]
QLSLITENMNEGIVIADLRNNILSCNSGALKLLGVKNVGEGQSIYLLNDSETFRHCIQNAMGGRNSSCILKTPDGEREVIASPSNTTDTVNGIVVFIFDVTEKQQLETMRREFTSNVSHELKTPLTTIYGISDMLANGIVKPEDVGHFGKNIRSEAERLIILINDIVSLSKLDENSIPRDDVETDLYELAEKILERLRHSASEKDISLSLSGEHVSITGNRTVLDEIIYNLCDNAIKYNKVSGRVEVKVSHIPTKILVTVSDTGMGIPSEHINRIFERFYRVDKSHSRQIKGTGLGLSIVKHGVIYHNGTIRVESKVGKGSVFIVEFPTENRK